VVCRGVSCLMPKRFRMSGLSEKGVTSPPVLGPDGISRIAHGASRWSRSAVALGPKHSGSSAPEEVGFAVDSLLEGNGFELPVRRLRNFGQRSSIRSARNGSSVSSNTGSAIVASSA
jgi:hypothetical protein